MAVKSRHGQSGAQKALDSKEKLTEGKKKKQKQSDVAFVHRNLIHPMTLEASAVLFLAILTAWLWNFMRPDIKNSPQQSFIDLVCRQPDTSCIGSLRATETITGMTTKTTQSIRKGTVVLKIPRRLQIWDEDALQDDTIQQILSRQEKPLDNSAVLSLYIARWQRELRDNQSFQQVSSSVNPVLAEYLLHQLPTYEHFKSYHPVFWDDAVLAELLRRSSLSYAYVKDIQRLVQDEYASLSEHVDRKDYYAARLSVLTRSFGTKTTQADGSYAMVPILDSFDHQTPPNVGFAAQANGDFVITALVNFRGNIHDNYGKRSDPNMFARYGFVNGDGTEYTQAGINLWHPVELQDTAQEPLSKTMEQELRRAILRYLQYDDGYPECVAASPVEADVFAQDAWRLKQLKYNYLFRRARLVKHWVVTVSPRNAEKRDGIPSLDPAAVKFDATMLMATCRVLSLTHEDYTGKAIDMLESNLLDMDYILPETRDGLEFRTLFCMSRMSSTAMEQFVTTIDLEKELINELEPRSTKWMAAHLRLGELQTLQALKHVSFSKLRVNYGDNMLGSSPEYSMRSQQCPKELLKPLLDLESGMKQQ